MRKVLVCHRNWSTNRDVPVAEVKCEGETVEDALDFAYHCTQNADNSWCLDDNPAVKCLVQPNTLFFNRQPLDLRSTRIGDMLMCGEGVFLVAARGFKKLNLKKELMNLAGCW